MQNYRVRILLTLMLIFFTPHVSLMAQSNYGEVQIYVFSSQGLPMEGVEVKVDGDVYRSDVDGLIDFTHPPGTHEFTLLKDGVPVGRLEIPIRQREATEVIVTASEENLLKQFGTDVEAEREQIEKDERVALDKDAPQGILAGTVTAIETGEPVEDATIIFRGVNFEMSTDGDGRFSAEVPVGTYSFSVIHPDFSTQTQDNIEVLQNQETTVEVTLTPSAIRLDEIPVFASEEVIVQGGIANLIEETRNSSVVLNLIGAEQIGRTGDSDAAGALKRVTGLTVVGGRFVYVRGMGERYSSSLLNDARLPSPEPARRVVPLDLFPASVIESIAVQKSYSADLHGDFGGGAISIRSAGIPDDRYRRRLRTNISTSVGYNQGTSLTERFAEQRNSLDFLGIDDGTRELVDKIDSIDFLEKAEGAFPEPGDFTEGELAEFGRSLPNTWAPVERTIPLNYGINASVRDKIEITDERSFGFNIAALYSNSWGYDTGQLNSYYNAGGGEVSPYNTYNTEITAHDIDIGALIDLVYVHNPNLSIETTSLLLRTTDSTYEILEGRLFDENFDVRLTEMAWLEQMLLSQASNAEIVLKGLNNAIIETQYTFSLAQRFEPDTRFTRYEEQISGFSIDNNYNEEFGHFSDRQEDDTQRVWTTVRDFVHDGRVSIEIPVFWFGNVSPDFMDFGLYGMYQTRETDLRRFGFVPTGEVKVDTFYRNHDLGEVLDPEHIGVESDDKIQFQENTYPADNYVGSHFIGAFYATTDFLLLWDIRMNAGLRVEYSRQDVEAYTFPEGIFENPVLAAVDFLPTLNFTIPVSERGQIRLGGSRTINRPDLRELSASPFFGPPGFGVLEGNPDLERAKIWNVDIRWETYLTQFESISLGAFYKFFQDAIEIAQLTGAAFEKVPVNTAQAYNLGVELEWAVQFRFMSDIMRSIILSLDFDSLERERRWRRALGGLSSIFRDLRTTGNVALIQSQIDYGGKNLTYRGTTISNTSKERPLSGQAPYVINAALGYRNEVSWSQNLPIHTSMFLNYNVVGPFITQLGVDNVADQYQQPFHQLDLVVRQQLGFRYSVSFEIGNILDPFAERTVGKEGDIVEQGRRGRTFSLSVSLDI